MEQLSEVSDFDSLLTEPLAIVFKHSMTCGISARADGEAERFLSDHPDHRIYKVDVHRARPLSNYIENHTGIRHESPQLLVLRHGEVVWHGSHGSVTADAIATSVA